MYEFVLVWVVRLCVCEQFCVCDLIHSDDPKIPDARQIIKMWIKTKIQKLWMDF